MRLWLNHGTACRFVTQAESFKYKPAYTCLHASIANCAPRVIDRGFLETISINPTQFNGMALITSDGSTLFYFQPGIKEQFCYQRGSPI